MWYFIIFIILFMFLLLIQAKMLKLSWLTYLHLFSNSCYWMNVFRQIKNKFSNVFPSINKYEAIFFYDVIGTFLALGFMTIHLFQTPFLYEKLFSSSGLCRSDLFNNQSSLKIMFPLWIDMAYLLSITNVVC